MLTSRQTFLINVSSVFGLQTLDGFVRNCTVQLRYFHSQRCQCLARKDQKKLERTRKDLFRPWLGKDWERLAPKMMKCCLNLSESLGSPGGLESGGPKSPLQMYLQSGSCRSWASSANSGSCSLCKWVSEPDDFRLEDGGWV